jgi:hypothetical protein
MAANFSRVVIQVHNSVVSRMTVPNDSVHVLLLLLGRNLSDMGLKGTLFLFDDLTMPGITAKS